MDTQVSTNICQVCGKEYKKSHRKTCSRACSVTLRYRTKNLRVQSRSAMIASGRKFVCANCGYDKHVCCIELHHLDGNPYNNSDQNLVLLCVLCHRLVHSGILVL